MVSLTLGLCGNRFGFGESTAESPASSIAKAAPEDFVLSQEIGKLSRGYTAYFLFSSPRSATASAHPVQKNVQTNSV
jgi:hypothetical protein